MKIKNSVRNGVRSVVGGITVGFMMLLTLVYFNVSAAAQDRTEALIVPAKSDGQPRTDKTGKANPLDDDKTTYWRIRDAIVAALENNVDIAIQRKNVRIAEFSLRAAQGVYDPFVNSSMSLDTTAQPNDSRFSGLATNQSSTSSKSFTSVLGLQKQIGFGGGTFQASFTNQRTSSNSALLSPLYSPQLSFDYIQPLWRNRRIDLNRRNIYVAKKTLTLTDAQFRQLVISVIAQVQQAYWNLAFAIRNVTVQIDGVELAQKQIDDNEKQLQVGTLAPLDVISAKATLETRRQALIQAEEAAVQAQNVLKILVVNGTQSELWNKEIFPTDFFEKPSITLSLSEALKNANANRPEVAQIKTQKEINDIDIDYYRNQTNPQVDLVVTYALTGAGGKPISTLVCPTGTTLNTSGTQLCIPGNLPPTVTPAAVNNSIIGGYGTALGNLFSNKYREITVGVNINFPIRNRTAKANLGQAIETAEQTDLQLRKQLQTIESDVRNAYQAVILSQRNLNAARLARQYAEIQLDGEQKKFAAGLSTTFLVLTRQDELIQARGAEVSALAAYNNAVAVLQQATGATLESNNIELK